MARLSSETIYTRLNNESKLIWFKEKLAENSYVEEELPDNSYDKRIAALPSPSRGQVAGPALKQAILCFLSTVFCWAATPMASEAYLVYSGASHFPVWWMPLFFTSIAPSLWFERKVRKILIVPFVRTFTKANRVRKAKIVPKVFSISMSYPNMVRVTTCLSAIAHWDIISTGIVLVSSLHQDDDWCRLFELDNRLPFGACAIAIWTAGLFQLLWGAAATAPLWGCGQRFRPPRGRDRTPKPFNLNLTEADLNDAVVYDTIMKQNAGHVRGLEALMSVCRMSTLLSLSKDYDRASAADKQLIQPAMQLQNIYEATWLIVLFYVIEAAFSLHLRVSVLAINWRLGQPLEKILPALLSINIGIVNGILQIRALWAALSAMSKLVEDVDLHAAFLHQEVPKIEKSITKHGMTFALTEGHKEVLWNMIASQELSTPAHIKESARAIGPPLEPVVVGDLTLFGYLNKTIQDGLTAKRSLLWVKAKAYTMVVAFGVLVSLAVFRLSLLF